MDNCLAGQARLRPRELRQANAEVKRMNDELELLWVQGIQELEAVNRKLREAQVELAYINRVTTMGELTASIAQEVMQPLAAIVNKANAGILFLATQAPDLQ